jgi:predicted ATPase
MTQTSDSTLIRRVRLRNYKSIAACDVELGPLTFLVGPNGAGKSNFLDALRLVSEGLSTSLEHAIRGRGGFRQVLRSAPEQPKSFGIRLDFEIVTAFARTISGHFALEVGARGTGYEIQAEECFLQPGPGERGLWYRVQGGAVSGNFEPPPTASPDRLYLVAVSGLGSFRPVYEALSRMCFYSLDPKQIADIKPLEGGAVLARDGQNIASVLTLLEAREPATKQRIEEYLAKVVPGIRGVGVVDLGPVAAVQFKQEVAGSPDPWPFFADAMSDGTLRTLGVLVALFQPAGRPESMIRLGEAELGVMLVGIEEPEVALHPSAAAVLMDSLRDASTQRQILVTSHSPDLLDNPNVSDREVLAVISEQNETKMGRLDEAGRSTLRDHLYTAGELLRANQLFPDDVARGLKPEQLSLFDHAP